MLESITIDEDDMRIPFFIARVMMAHYHSRIKEYKGDEKQGTME